MQCGPCHMAGTWVALELGQPSLPRGALVLTVGDGPGSGSLSEGLWVYAQYLSLSLGSSWLAHPGQGPYRLQAIIAQGPEAGAHEWTQKCGKAGRLPHLSASFSLLLCLPGWPCELCDCSESCQKPVLEHRGPWAFCPLSCTPNTP